MRQHHPTFKSLLFQAKEAILVTEDSRKPWKALGTTSKGSSGYQALILILERLVCAQCQGTHFRPFPLKNSPNMQQGGPSGVLQFACFFLALRTGPRDRFSHRQTAVGSLQPPSVILQPPSSGALPPSTCGCRTAGSSAPPLRTALAYSESK